jgi:hypothetical protein
VSLPFGRLDEFSDGELPRVEVDPGFVSDEPLTLMRSVVLRGVGVPDLDDGRSRSDAAGRVGSELFCVILSRRQGRRQLRPEYSSVPIIALRRDGDIFADLTAAPSSERQAATPAHER